jgi:hypothetical protein
MIELSYAKRAAGFFEKDHSNVELRGFATIYDSPNAPERITYTY